MSLLPLEENAQESKKEFKLKEVIFPKPLVQYEDKECPNCKEKKLVHGMIPCPDGRAGCCVCHYGYTCQNCWKIFQ